MLKTFSPIIIAALSLTLSGCLKVQVIPDGAISNTIKSGKSMIDEKRMKKKGAIKRVHSTQVNIADHASRVEAEQFCSEVLRSKLAEESTAKAPEVASEKTVQIDAGEADVIECQLVGYVWIAADDAPVDADSEE